jgi:hypothetical protein
MPDDQEAKSHVPVFVRTPVEIMPEDAWEQVGAAEAYVRALQRVAGIRP